MKRCTVCGWRETRSMSGECAQCRTKRQKTERERAKFTPVLAAVRDRLAATATSGGWDVEVGAGSRFDNHVFDDSMSPGGCWLMASHRVPVPDKPGHEMVVRITLNVAAARDSYFRKCAYDGARIEGETEYQVVATGEPAKGWWHGWVRTGVDCASVWLEKRAENGSPYYNNLPALLDGEMARCVNSEVRSRTLRAVPGTGFSRQPEWFTKATEDLKAGRTVRLMPSGFGVGYVIYKGRGRDRWDKRAPAELERTLGVAPLFMQSLDCD